jgi:uncharacterized RDD family membrane protein YckC
MAVGVGRIRDASGRLVSAPVRAVRSGMEGMTATAGERLESEVERAADVVLAGPFPEALARLLVERRVVERVVAQMVESGELDRTLSTAVNADATERLVREIAASPMVDRLVTEAAESPRVAELVERIVRRPELQQAMEEAVRAALAQRAATLRDRVVDGTRRMDARLEATPRRWVRRPARSTSAYAGLASRTAAFLVDVVVVHFAFLVGAAMVGLVLALANVHPSHELEGALGTAGWLAAMAVYFAGFWATAGQTLGMASFRMRVVAPDGGVPGWGRSLVRLAGGLVAAAFVFLGFLPVLLDDKRRALPDFVARTAVVYEPDDVTAAAPA